MKMVILIITSSEGAEKIHKIIPKKCYSRAWHRVSVADCWIIIGYKEVNKM